MLTWSQVKGIAYLRAAQSLIREREQWTSGCLAIDAHGVMVPPTDPGAVAWSARGALIRVTCFTHATNPVIHGVHAALDFAVPCWIRGEEQKDYVEYCNDHEKITHEDVIELYERAIAIVKDGK